MRDEKYIADEVQTTFDTEFEVASEEAEEKLNETSV